MDRFEDNGMNAVSTVNFSAGAGLGAQASATGGASYGLTANAALAAGEAKNSSTTRHNAEITAGGALKTVSGRDTTISGANLLGDQVDMRVGRNLRVESVRDYARASSSSRSAGVQMTVGMGATAGGSGSAGGDGNLAYATGNSDSDFIGRQTSIIGVSGVNIHTGDNTHIKGAIIAALNDNLTLNTGTLNYEDMTGKKTSSSWSMGISGRWTPDSSSASGGDSRPQTNSSSGSSQSWLQNLTATQKELKDQWTAFKQDMIFAPGAFTYSGSEIEQTALATVGRGAIIVRDNPGMDLSGLNRDTSKALTEETIRNTNFEIDPLFSYVDSAFNYTDAALHAPEKIDDVSGFVNDPNRFIMKKWEQLLKKWGIGNNKPKP